MRCVFAFILCTTTVFGIPGQIETTIKTGVCISPKSTRCDDMNSAGSPFNVDAIGWHYNWGRYSVFETDPNKATPGLQCDTAPTKEFVPMIWGISQNHIDTGVIDVQYIDTVDTKYLLGFNEPNRIDQGNLFPDEAADFYKDYIIPLWGDTHTLVSPCPHGGSVSKCITGYTDATEWLDDFFAEFDGADLETQITNSGIEYIAAHAYTCNVQDAMDNLYALSDHFKRDIWLTEFACGSNTKTEQQQIDYIDDMITELENADYIFRYAWFSSRKEDDERSLLVYDGFETATDPVLNSVGQAYIATVNSAQSPVFLRYIDGGHHGGNIMVSLTIAFIFVVIAWLIIMNAYVYYTDCRRNYKEYHAGVTKQ